MKFLLLLSLFSYLTWAEPSHFWISIEKKDGTKVEGEWLLNDLRKAVDNPFARNPEVSAFTVFVPQASGDSRIVWVDRKDVLRTLRTPMESSVYKDYLYNNDLLLQRLPVYAQGRVSPPQAAEPFGVHRQGNFTLTFESMVDGTRFHDNPANLRNYHFFGNPVLAPVSGTVVAVSRSQADNPPNPRMRGDLKSMGEGNYVLIHVGGSFFVAVLHLQKYSIPINIKVGEFVKSGSIIGAVGNSGRSFVPHIQIGTYYLDPVSGRLVNVPNYFESVRAAPPSNKFTPLRAQEVYQPALGDLLQSMDQPRFYRCARIYGAR